jgi:hypothetical protein
MVERIHLSIWNLFYGLLVWNNIDNACHTLVRSRILASKLPSPRIADPLLEGEMSVNVEHGTDIVARDDSCSSMVLEGRLWIFEASMDPGDAFLCKFQSDNPLEEDNRVMMVVGCGRCCGKTERHVKKRRKE